MGRERASLVEVVRAQEEERACWEKAEATLLESVFRARLDALGVEVTPDLAVALMAVAMVLAEASPEFGGDARDVMGDLAALGLSLLGDDDVA